MDAQKNALLATNATVDALKTQADLRVNPLQDQLQVKDATIEMLREGKFLAEQKLKATEEKTNHIIDTLPLEIARRVREAIDAERLKALAAAEAGLQLGYCGGIINLASLAAQVQVLTFERLDKEEIPEQEYAFRAAAEYLRDIALLFNRENREAAKYMLSLLGPETTSTASHVRTSLSEIMTMATAVDEAAQKAEVSISPEVESLSAVRVFSQKSR